MKLRTFGIKEQQEVRLFSQIGHFFPRQRAKPVWFDFLKYYGRRYFHINIVTNSIFVWGNPSLCTCFPSNSALHANTCDLSASPIHDISKCGCYLAAFLPLKIFPGHRWLTDPILTNTARLCSWLAIKLVQLQTLSKTKHSIPAKLCLDRRLSHFTQLNHSVQIREWEWRVPCAYLLAHSCICKLPPKGVNNTALPFPK